jgi:hypothetical protein
MNGTPLSEVFGTLSKKWKPKPSKKAESKEKETKKEEKSEKTEKKEESVSYSRKRH